MKVRVIVLLVLVLANVGALVAQECEKYCGCVYPYIPFARSCEWDTCHVSECIWTCPNCGYEDPHNDFCLDPLYGCFYY